MFPYKYKHTYIYTRTRIVNVEDSLFKLAGLSSHSQEFVNQAGCIIIIVVGG
jgi:hypothetical protein